MRWQGRRQSDNIEDRRGRGAGGAGGPVAIGGGAVGLIIVVVFLLMGGDPRMLMQQQGPANPAAPPVNQRQQDELSQFVGVVLADTEDVWGELFRSELGQRYPQPNLVLFSGRVDSACGLASAAVGPFYCPADQKVYLDLSFFQQLRDQLGAPGDFAMAYVIAHEIGHHVQNQVGPMDEVHRQQQRMSETEANRLSVRLELQADYLAGVWAHHAQATKQILEAGDVEEAIVATQAIGDDRLQRQSSGFVRPDSFTHGTSNQRTRWFRKGLESGDLRAMNQLFELPYSEL